MVRSQTTSQQRRDEDAVRKWLAKVSAAAMTFEARWTMAALQRVDADLAQRLREQRNLFDEATITGSSFEVWEHGEAMCRGYAAVCSALERAEAPDDAYVLGLDPTTGQRVAIGVQRAAVPRVLELYGSSVIWVTPDEVAALVGAGPRAVEFAAEVKRIWPGAELIAVRNSSEGS